MNAIPLKNMFIRRYRQTDMDAMIHIFRETAAADLRKAGEPALHISSFLWCRPYLVLQPEHCFVLDDGAGRPVGYVIGTPNTATFVQQWEEDFLPYAEAEGVSKPHADEETGWKENLPNALRFFVHLPEHLLRDEEPDLMKNYPAHLHIDILPDFQRKGMGRQMIDTFCQEVKTHGASGVHLVMASDNIEGAKFYTAIGFQRYPQVVDGGSSGENGRDNSGNLWQVKRL